MQAFCVLDMHSPIQIILVNAGSMAMYGLGLAMVREDTAHAWNFSWVIGYMYTLTFVHYGIPLPFLYRYLLMCRCVSGNSIGDGRRGGAFAQYSFSLNRHLVLDTGDGYPGSL